jgi:hypothetical protein
MLISLAELMDATLTAPFRRRRPIVLMFDDNCPMRLRRWSP